MTDNKIIFAISSKGKPSVVHKHYEFVKHREYVNGNIQWRCKRYQNCKCQARLTTKNDEIVGDCDPQHNHDGNKDNILARQAVAEMKDKMGELSATPTAVICSVSMPLQPGVLMALPNKNSLKRTLHRKRHKLQLESDSPYLPPPPSDMTARRCVFLSLEEGTTRNMETQTEILSTQIKQEPHNKNQTVEEASGDEESDISPVIKRSSISSMSVSFPDEDSFIYCEECQQKYEGGCPEHGALVYVDNAETTRNMETQTEILSAQIKQEPHNKTTRNMETQTEILSAQIKQEPHNKTTRNMETQTEILSAQIKQEPHNKNQTVKEASGDEESDMFPAIKRSSISSMSVSFPDEDSFIYCEECQQKYEGGCPDHGALVYVDNAEADEMSTELYVAGSSCGSQSNDEIQEGQKIYDIGKTFTCDVCGAGFIYLSYLKIHKRTHTGEKPYKCDLCGVGYNRSGDLKRHKETHTGEKPYKCDMCGVGFFRNGDLNRHKRTHTGERPHKCDVCGIGFAWREVLKAHKRTHTGEKPYKCDVCGVGFFQSRDLKKHMRTHTGEKSYKCDACGVGFFQSRDLKKHKRTHTGEKTFNCDICDVGFAQNGALKIHKRIHTGEKPYKCDVCGVGFAQNGALKIHKRRHTGEKPYKCDICDVGFAQNGALKLHKRTHTDVMP